MESVDALHGGGALLAVAENQVDPQVEMGAHKFALQGLGTGVGVARWVVVRKLGPPSEVISQNY